MSCIEFCKLLHIGSCKLSCRILWIIVRGCCGSSCSKDYNYRVVQISVLGTCLVGLGLRVLFADHGVYRIVCGANPWFAGSHPLTAPLVVSLPTSRCVPELQRKSELQRDKIFADNTAESDRSSEVECSTLFTTNYFFRYTLYDSHFLLVQYTFIFYLFYWMLYCAYCLTFSLSDLAIQNWKNPAPLPCTERGAAGQIWRLTKYIRVVRLCAPGHYLKSCNYVLKSSHCRVLSCLFHRVSRYLCRRVSSRSCHRVVSFLRANSFR